MPPPHGTWGDPKESGIRKLFDAFENIDGLVLSKEVLSFRTFGGLSFEEF